MSITTMGWGSGAITTTGFGAGAAVAIPPTPTLPCPDAIPSILLLQTKLAAKCKIEGDTWLTKIAGASGDLSSLESDIARLTSLLRIVETTDPLLVQSRLILDCKIGETDFDDKVAAADVSLDSIAANLSNLQSRIYTLESSLRTYMRQQRI